MKRVKLVNATQKELDIYVENVLVPLSNKIKYAKKSTFEMRKAWDEAGETVEFLKLQRDRALARRANRKRFSIKDRDQYRFFA